MKSSVNKVNATLKIKNQITIRQYKLRDSTSCIKFLKVMETNKEDINIIGKCTVPYTNLILLYSQEAFRQGLEKEKVRDINKERAQGLEKLSEQHGSQATWLEFNKFYETAFAEKGGVIS